MIFVILCGLALIVTAACTPQKQRISRAELPPDVVSNAMTFVTSSPTNRLSAAACLASSFERFIMITTNGIISEELVISLLGKPNYENCVLPKSLEYEAYRKNPGPQSPSQLLVFEFHQDSLVKAGTCLTEP